MKTSLLAVVFAVLSAPAFAATISVTSFTKPAYDSAVGSMNKAVVQNFEGTTEGMVGASYSTNVGTFSSLGGTGSGGTVTDYDGFANDGTELTLRDGNVYGRTSTTKTLTGNAGDDMFLDSNDTKGIAWDVSLGGSLFNRLVFTLTDATDVGAIMTIKFGDTVLDVLSGLKNAETMLVEIDFGMKLTSASIFFTNSRINDGLSLDDIAVSEVPLPASALLLLGGLGGLAAFRRRSA